MLQQDELKEHLRKLGFYREPPTPELLREAQEVYHKLKWQPPEDEYGSPLPCPPIISKEALMDEDILDELDTHALETPSSYLTHRIALLVEFLIRPAETDVEKARVLTRWLARCLDDDYIRDLPRSTWSHAESTAMYLWKLRRREIDYDELFHVLCKHAGLKCFAVSGCVRNTIKYEVGDDFREQKKTWTVVLLDGQWRVMDVRWICEAAYGVLKNNWRLIEDENGKVSQRRAMRENRGSFKTHVRFRDYYFLTEPEMFIYDHFPDDEKFQLLARPMSYEEARDAASLRSDFFRHDLYLRSHPKNRVHCPDGTVTFVLGMKKKKSMAFVYKLYRSKGSREVTASSRNTLDRYVFLERDMEEGDIRATIRCPAEGQYLFELHGSETNETHHALLVTYIIECTGISASCRPLPPNMRQEWGPGEDTKDMGMTAVTHKKGEVEAEDGDAEIKFTLQKDLEFRHDLIRGEKDEPVSSRHIMHSIENGKMAINLRLPEPGEYSLNVLAKERHKKTRFAPACSYLVSCQDEPIQTKPFPDIEEGNHLGPNEDFRKLGFSEDDPWPSYISNLVTGEFRMHIKRPPGVYVFATLMFEEGLKKEAYDNYVMCDTQDDTVTITSIFPKHGSYKLTVFARPPNISSTEGIPIYVKIIDVVLPTLTGMPSPIQTPSPEWCLGYRLKAPRTFYLLAHEVHKVSLAMPEARIISVKDHSECKLKQTDGQFWEGYVRTGTPGSVVEILAIGRTGDVPFRVFTYEVVSKEDSLQIEMKQEQLFQKALDELRALEDEKQMRLTQRLMQAIKQRDRTKVHKWVTRMREINAEKMAAEIANGEAVLRELEIEEKRMICRKELRRATRACEGLALEAALEKCRALRLEEEDGDLTSARDILTNMLGRPVPKHEVIEPEIAEPLNRSRETFQQTADQIDTGNRSFDAGNKSFDAGNRSFDAGNRSFDRGNRSFDTGNRSLNDTAPIHLVSKNKGLHIYVVQDDQLPVPDFSSVANDIHESQEEDKTVEEKEENEANEKNSELGFDQDDSTVEQSNTIEFASPHVLNTTRDACLQTDDSNSRPEPVQLKSSGGVHIYISQTEQVPHLDFNTVVNLDRSLGRDSGMQTLRDDSGLHFAPETSTPREPLDRATSTPKKGNSFIQSAPTRISVPSMYSSINNGDDDENSPREGDAEQSFRAAEDALNELELEENMNKVKSMVRDNMRSASRLTETETLQEAINDFKRMKLQEEGGDLSFAEDQFEIMSCAKEAYKRHRSWRSRTMDVFKHYWKVMKDKSAHVDETLNEDIDHEIQRLRIINTMCRKMAKAAKSIGRNWEALIESEQSFNEILSEQPEVNKSLGEDLGNTTLLQHEMIGVETEMKTAFDDLAGSLDQMCASMIGKAEISARELEAARMDMERETLLIARSDRERARSRSPGRHTRATSASPSRAGSTRSRAKELAIKTSFYALRTNILEEISKGNEQVEEEIRQKLAELQRHMAEFHGGNNSSRNDSLNEIFTSWSAKLQ
ncbi:uncharacterized protein LOC110454848 isoform X2 [Mizuhopecten yessoensis]|uniref:uncharacterized protein LOC110454848 isoform X2 n=1 Tax=Mizuhopecten yessoensis TaxID=6573 RepID=UPI000B45EB51|nr:uncharacterized protein LOC110454848 isoform X2 [Mizuhopecten yessoensis]